MNNILQPSATGKTYDNILKSTFNSFIKGNIRYKIFFILRSIGIKFILYHFFYFLFNLFNKLDFRFFRGIHFDLSKYKSLICYYDNGIDKFLLHTNDSEISKNCYVNGTFDLEKLEKVLNLLGDSFKLETIYDVGANIGTICIPAVNRGLAKYAKAIEPEKKNYKLLKLNISLNDLEDNIDSFNYALSSRDNELLDLEKSNNNYGDHRVRINDNLKGEYSEEIRNTEKIESITFDTLFPNFNSKNSLVFMDTQGFEAYILLGAKKLTSTQSPIVLEFWPYALKRTNSFDILKNILKNYLFYYDLSELNPQKININKKSLDNLFSGWDEEQSDKGNLFTDILIL